MFFGGRYDRAEILRRVRYLEPTAGLRAEFQYQNIMFLAAGEAVVRAAGTSWDGFVEQRIFVPLGMGSSSTSIRALEGRANVATPHALVDGAVRPLRWRNIDNIGPAGSINSTASDMTAWLRLHLGNGTYRGNRVFSEQSAQALRAPQIVLPPSRMGSMDAITKAGAASRFFTYALGWVVFDYRGKRVMWHGGNIDGMAAVVAMMPEEKLGLVVLTNLDGNTLRDAVMLRVFDHFLGGPTEDWSKRLLAVAREGRSRSRPEPRPVAQPLGAPRRYQGRYRDRLLGDLVITADGAELRFALATGLTGKLIAHGDSFQVGWDDPGIPIVISGLAAARVRFVVHDSGQVTAAEFTGVGRFTRVGAGRSPPN